MQEKKFLILSQHSRSSGLKNKLIGNIQNPNDGSDISSIVPLTFDPNKFQNLPKIQVFKPLDAPKEIHHAPQNSNSFQKKNSYNSKKGVLSSRYNEFTSEEEPV